MTRSIDPKLEAQLRHAAHVISDDGFSAKTILRLKRRRVRRLATLIGALGVGLSASWPGMQFLFADHGINRLLGSMATMARATAISDGLPILATLAAISVCVLAVFSLSE